MPQSKPWGRMGALKGALKGVKEAGTEFSHWIPARLGGPRAWWNGQAVSVAEHAITDSFRYRFMPVAFKDAVKGAWNPVRQQLNRLPQVARFGIFAPGTASINSQF